MLSYRDVLPIGVEIWVAPSHTAPYWMDITEDLSDEGVRISRSADDATRIEFKFRSPDGKYAPRNVRSPLWGLIGRNTPCRVWVEEGSPRLVLWSDLDAFIAPASAATVTNDLDVRFDVTPWAGWRPEFDWFLGAHQPGSWGIQLNPDGTLAIKWTTSSGATTTEQTLTSLEAVPGAITGRKSIRVTLDVDNGAGKTVANFYVSDSVSGPWEAFGSPVVADGTTSILDGNEYLRTASPDTGCDVHALQVRDGINGTVIADVDFSLDVHPTEIWDSTGHWRTSVTDAAGVVWEQQAAARLWNRRYRGRGEVTEWPQEWGLKGPSSVVVRMLASGIKRRLGQGAGRVQSAIRRGCESLGAPLVAYWPCEDGRNATQFEPAGSYSAGSIIGTPFLASYSGFACSEPIAEVASGRLTFSVPPMSATGQLQIRWLNHLPTSDFPADTVLLRLTTTGSLGRVDVCAATGGNFSVKSFSRAGVQLGAQTAAFAANDRDMRLSLELEQDGADCSVRLVQVEAGFSTGLFSEYTVAGQNFGSATQILVNPNSANLSGWAFGHLTVERATSTVFDLVVQFAAYDGERANSRVRRLGEENGVDVLVIGHGAGWERLGQQPVGTMLDLMKEAVDSEQGFLYESRDRLGLVFRSLEAVCSQDPPPATIVHTDNLLIPFRPIDDDGVTRNKVTVQRKEGAAATVEDTSSRLSSLPPPAGVGLYDEAVTLSLSRDASCEQQAGWRVHMGTVDEARWPTIGLDLAHPMFAGDASSPGDPDLVASILDLDIGDRFDVLDPPPWLPPGPVRVIITGYTETMTPAPSQDRNKGDRPNWHHRIEFECTPASPYQTGRWVASSYLTETTTTTTTTTVEVGTDPVVLVEDSFTGANGSALSDVWTTGFTGLGTVNLQNGWARIAVGSSGIVSRRLTTTPALNKGNITFKYRVSGRVYPEFIMRHNSTTLDRQNDYGIRLPTPQDTNLKLYKHANYSYGSALGSAPFPVVAGQTVLVRVSVDTSRFKVKCWAEGATEPDNWMIDVADTTYTSAGYWGFYAGSGGTAGNYLEVDSFHWDDGATGTTTQTTTTTTTNTTATPVLAGPSPWRWDNPNTQLHVPVDGTATTMQISITAGTPWTTDSTDFPFDLWIDGETVTVTGVVDIVNLALNPDLDVNATNWSGDLGNDTPGTAGRSTIGGFSGPALYRLEF